MNEFFKETINNILNFFSGNETIQEFLISSVKYIPMLTDNKDTGFFLFIASGFITLMLFIDLIVLIKKSIGKNFFSIIFSFLFLLIFAVISATCYYIYEQEKNEKIISTFSLGKPSEVNKYEISTDYIYGSDIYKINNNCKLTEPANITIHISSRGFKFADEPFNPDCRYIKSNKNESEYD